MVRKNGHSVLKVCGEILGVAVQGFEVVGAEVAEGAVKANGIAEPLDVVGDGEVNALAGWPGTAVNELLPLLLLVVEALDDGVAVAVASTGHALPDAEAGEPEPKLAAHELSAAIAVEDETRLDVATADAHVEGVGDELRSHVVGGGPANDPEVHLAHFPLQPVVADSDAASA